MRLISLTEGKPGKKLKAVVEANGKIRTIHFGNEGSQDFTTSKDPKKKAAYLARHAVREDWTASGVQTSGFWARWILWNKPTIEASLRDVMKRFSL